MRTEEVLKYLGISRSGLAKLIARGKIKYSKPGGKIRYFRKGDLDNYMLGKLNDAEFLTSEGASQITGLSQKTIVQLAEQDLIPNWLRRGEYLFQRGELMIWTEEYKKRGFIK